MNDNIIDFLPMDACIEVNCVIIAGGPIPMGLTKVPEHVKCLIHAVKTYERLTVEAAVTGSRDLVLQALVHHPLVPSVAVAKTLMEEMLEKNKAYLPAFFK